MADEVSGLGVNWVEESALRSDVAAEVDASSGPGAAGDDAELRRRWAALEEAERDVAELRAALAVAERGAGDEEKCGAAALRFRLARVQRDVESRATSLRRWQREIEVRQRKRIDIARQQNQLIKQTEITALAPTSCDLAGSLRGFSSAFGAAGSSTAASISTSVTIPNGKQCESNGVHGGVKSLACLMSVASQSSTPDSVVSRSHYPLKTTTLPENVATTVRSDTATELRCRDESETHLGLPAQRAIRTLAEYSGGAILPSLYRVTLTRSDVSSKSRRYADDGDIDTFHARQQKRKRLEAIAADMKVLQSASLVSGSVKVEVDDGMRHTKKQDKNGSTSVEAIDVDALMEEADEDVEIILQRRLASVVRNDDDSAKKEQQEMFVSVAQGMFLPVSINQRLLEYQREGVRWLLQLHMKQAGGILGDEMGLGKTIQIATMLNALHDSQQLHGPCLIVSPVTVLRQWVAELHRWAPYMRICVMHESSGTSMSREGLVTSVRGTPAVLLTTYTAVRQYCQLLHTAGFQYIIIDEGHKISNPETTLTLAVKSFPTPHRLILSGTPIQNTLKELWSLFDFVKPGLLGTMTKFVSEFEEPINASKSVSASSLVLATAVECARALRERISPYLLRRLKRHVLNHLLPQKYERVIRCPLSDSQLEAYVELLTSPQVQRLLGSTLSYTQIWGGLDPNGRDASGCLNIAGQRFRLMQRQQQGSIRFETFFLLNKLRQICNHVDIFRVRQMAEENSQFFWDDDADYTCFHYDAQRGDSKKEADGQKRRPYVGISLRSNLPVNYQGSGKLSTLLKLMKVWQSGGQRVLVFSQTRRMLDIIENMCEQEGFTYIRMDGTTNSHHRQELMDRFNEDKGIIAALLTTRVGGVGVNLVGANRVVLFDPDWNPVTDEQARERAWRIGQRSDVCVYRLIASGTVEEAILRRQLAKRYVSEKVLHNPELQRFFHQHESLVETFYLGAEYDSRVPQGKKHVLVAQELSPLLEKEGDDCDSGNSNSSDVDNNDSYTTNAEGNEKGMRAVGGNEQCSDSSVGCKVGSVVYRVKPIDSITASNSASHINNGITSYGQSGGVSCKRGEMALLQELVDGNEISLSATDVMSLRLARLSATRTMLRVTNTVRTIEQQQDEMRVKCYAVRKERKKKE